MALQVWLPLINNINNQGLDNITILHLDGFESGLNSVSGGKLGNCYRFTSHDSIGFESYPWMTMKPANNFSVFLWCKGVSTGWLFACGAWEFRLRPDFLQISVSTTGLYPAKYTATFDNDTWYHIGFTWEGSAGKLRLYLNGNEVAVSNVPSTANYNINSTFKFVYDGTRYINDFRLYDECLSQAEVSELAKGLLVHYTLDNIDRFIKGKNLVINSRGLLGDEGWEAGSKISDVPSSPSGIVCSYNNAYSNRILIDKYHTYTVTAQLKSVSSGGTWPSFRFFDIDNNLIQHYMTHQYMHTTARTTLAQPLKPGDTVIHCTDLSNFTTAPNWYIYICIFGYRDSTGYKYPDFTYTRDVIQIVKDNTVDKSSIINKTNNTITIPAYTGKYRKAGTAICQSTQGGWWLYPWGSINSSNTPNWTSKTYTFIPYTTSWGRYAKYMQYFTSGGNTYIADLKIIDDNVENLYTANGDAGIIQNEAGYSNYYASVRRYNNTNAMSTCEISTDTPRYKSSTYFDTYSDARSQFNPAPYAGDFTISLWVKIPKYTSGNYKAICTSKFYTAVSAGVGIYWNVNQKKLLWSTGNGSTGQEIWTANTLDNIVYDKWAHIVMVRNSSDAKHGYFYVNGIRQDLQSVPTILSISNSADVMHLSHCSGYSSYKLNARMSDFRYYATALSETDILDLYKLGARIDNKFNFHTLKICEPVTNLFTSEYIGNTKNNAGSYTGEIVERNGYLAYRLGPGNFYPNTADGTTTYTNRAGILLNSFKPNTSYVFDMWIDTDDVVYNGNNVTGGLTVRYTDNTTSSLSHTGSQANHIGFKHTRLITPANKTINFIEIYYWTGSPVYYRLDSYICEYKTFQIEKEGNSSSSNFRAYYDYASIFNGGNLHINDIIEV